ncbi:MFS transporter [Nonomuraea zeae]|uniref:MFS transporter n=1 Tax=Nonomuraea zeae TaxID=1642303 RepID=A0A5S4GIX6_9ACTN|nr:MFS transporter [Nonomuraea zeae]TMR26220.1 MFS transporter [Nonomuraea zeae]
MQDRAIAKAGLREWLGLGVLALPTLLVAVDINALFMALPQLSADLGTSGVEQLWITDIYGFMVAGLVTTMGTLGDRVGRRRLLLLGGAAFAVASVLAAYSASPAALIAWRAVQGVAGATLMPSTLALITNMFRDGRQRGVAIAVWATCQFTGGAMGPVVSGLLLEHFWWGSVFLVAVPVIAVLLVAGPAVLPEFRGADPGRLDLASVALSLLAVLPVVYGVKSLAAAGGGSPVVPLVALLVGGGFGVVFVRRQLRLEHPLLNLRLLTRQSFALILLALVLAGIAMAGTGLQVTQYLQSVLGYPPAEAALLFAPMGLGVALGTMLTPAITRWVSPKRAIAGGLVISAAGSLLLTGEGVPAAVAGVTVLALGTGPLFALGTGLIVGSVPPERAGSAASMSETANYLGGTLGMALLGTVAAAVYRHQAGVAHQAYDTVAGAVSAAAALPPEQATALIRASHEAFMSGLHTVAVLSAALFALLAVLMAWRFRPERPQEDPTAMQAVSS